MQPGGSNIPLRSECTPHILSPYPTQLKTRTAMQCQGSLGWAGYQASGGIGTLQSSASGLAV